MKSRLILILVGFMMLASIYSIVIPPFETPDEIWHFAFIQHLATGQGLPVSKPNTEALWRQQGVQAPGYYLAAAGLTFWIDQSDFPAIYARANPHRAIGRPDAIANRNYLVHHESEGWPWQGSILALHIARFFSVCLGTITLWATYKILERLLTIPLALLGTALFASIPQFIFISAAASNDNAVNALAALILWRLVVLLTPSHHPITPPSHHLVILGILLGFGILSKLSALGLVGLSGLTLLWVTWQNRSWRLILQSTIYVGIPMLAIGGWWYLRNWLLYADPLAWNIWQANILMRVEEAEWYIIVAELESLEHSFWGLFGWLNVRYPDDVYTGFRVIEILVGIGLLSSAFYWLWALSKGKMPESVQRGRSIAILLLMLWLLLLTISWLRFMRIAPAAQGRYFFPAAPALALLMALGLGFWRKQLIGWFVLLCLAALSAVTPFAVIAPTYSTPPSQAALQDTLQPIQADLEHRFRIVGALVESTELLPGQTAQVTIGWMALEPDEIDYSVFVHLLSEDGLIIAQSDTMPGAGQYPTSQWRAGEIRVETYDVKIPTTAYTPDRGTWAVGLYDHRSGQRISMQWTDGGPSQNGLPFIIENALRFGQIHVATPPGTVPNPIGVDFHDNITLLGYEFSSRRLQPSEQFTVTLYWNARGPVAHEYTTFAHLLDAGYDTKGGHDSVPQIPTTEWSSHDLIDGPIVDVHTFTVAEDANSGIYQLEIGLYTRPDFDRLTLVTSDGAEGADRLLLGPLAVVE